MNVLGLHASFWHDSAAAVVSDGALLAAVEQERISRAKHAVDELPIGAAEAALERAGIAPGELDLVAYSWSPEELARSRGGYLRRSLSRLGRARGPRRALRASTRSAHERRARQQRDRLATVVARLGLPAGVPVEWVDHHLAHAASAFYDSGFGEAAVVSVDGTSDRVTCLFAEGSGERLTVTAELQLPDSLGLFYSAFTEYLGFRANDGEYRLMGMAPYGDPARCNLDGLLTWGRGDIRVDADAVFPSRRRRFRGRAFGRTLVDRFGPPRQGDGLDGAYPHVAAAVQDRFERAFLHLLDIHLGAAIARTGNLCFAGGCALNVALNRRLVEDPRIRALCVPAQPADPGTAVGAAAVASARRGCPLSPGSSVYLGPSFGAAEIRRAARDAGVRCEAVRDAPRQAARLLAAGEVVGWFQGSMEWGPRALGNRSILGHPGRPGTARLINERIKFREVWRPFCPTLLARRAPEILVVDHPAPHMTVAFAVRPSWRERIPEVVHVDGTCRPQILEATANPLFHDLIEHFEEQSGIPCVLNTSLNRRGEPLACSPRDAIAVLVGSGLEHLFCESFHLTAPGSGGARCES